MSTTEHIPTGAVDTASAGGRGQPSPYSEPARLRDTEPAPPDDQMSHGARFLLAAIRDASERSDESGRALAQTCIEWFAESDTGCPDYIMPLVTSFAFLECTPVVCSSWPVAKRHFERTLETIRAGIMLAAGLLSATS